MPDSQPGIGVDAEGGAVIDPTANVLQLVEAAIKRQDDLRAAEAKHVAEVLRLRGEQRVQDLEHVKELGELRAYHAQELRQAEAARIDAIRAVDVGNVQRAAEVQATQASALAAQVVASAEALRNQVASAASAASIALAAALEPVQKDIADLRRAQYEAQGQKAQVVETRASSGAVVGYIVGGIGALVAVATLLTGVTSASMPRSFTDRDPGDETPVVRDLDVVKWRFDELERAGYPVGEAVRLAERADVDLHQAVELLERGASIEDALRILT
jgi:hypothetical protein